jgi:hypothetical protein
MTCGIYLTACEFADRLNRLPRTLEHGHGNTRSILTNLQISCLMTYLIRQLIEALDGMTRKFSRPYILFYPVVSRHGGHFPVNQCIRTIQGSRFNEQMAWRGDIVVGKYAASDSNHPFTNMVDASMADFAIIQNYLMTHGSPAVVRPLSFYLCPFISASQ